MLYLFSTEGRISREKFWKGFILYFVVSVIAYGFFTQTAFSTNGSFDGSSAHLMGFIIIFQIFAKLIFLLFMVRRIHDRDKSGWWVLLGLVPGLGFWWVVIEGGLLKGTSGSNKYGLDPLDSNDVLTVPIDRQ
ncbi:MAG: DUF805 domain-containing protein [Candidatus Pacebacteria bacterium]|nr:DUF805 domain-containing protein [Candidatus Paceibacterota bacterium]MBP9866799.1 DUF805 domain-containing protein [Candidatus Paceibacterota bacterium]